MKQRGQAVLLRNGMVIALLKPLLMLASVDNTELLEYFPSAVYRKLRIVNGKRKPYPSAAI